MIILSAFWVPINSNSLIIIILLTLLIYMGYSKKLEIQRLNMNFDIAIQMFEKYRDQNYMQNKLFENTIKDNTDAIVQNTEMIRTALIIHKALDDK